MTNDQRAAAARELHELCYEYGRDVALDTQSWSGNRQAHLLTVDEIEAILRKHAGAGMVEELDRLDQDAYFDDPLRGDRRA